MQGALCLGLPEIIQMQDAAERGRALSFLESQPVPVKTLQFGHHFSIDRSGTVDLPRACFEFKSMLHRPTHTTTVQARIASGLSRCTDQSTSRFGLASLFTFIFSITHSQWPSFASMSAPKNYSVGWQVAWLHAAQGDEDGRFLCGQQKDSSFRSVTLKF